MFQFYTQKRFQNQVQCNFHENSSVFHKIHVDTFLFRMCVCKQLSNFPNFHFALSTKCYYAYTYVARVSFFLFFSFFRSSALVIGMNMNIYIKLLKFCLKLYVPFYQHGDQSESFWNFLFLPHPPFPKSLFHHEITLSQTFCNVYFFHFDFLHIKYVMNKINILWAQFIEKCRNWFSILCHSCVHFTKIFVFQHFFSCRLCVPFNVSRKRYMDKSKCN